MTMKEFKARCKPGVKVHIENYRFPHLSRDTVISDRTSGRDLVTEREDADPPLSYLPWPQRKDVEFMGVTMIIPDRLEVTLLD